MEKIISSIPEELSEIEIIRYIYLKCGDLFTYNRDVSKVSWEEAIELYDKPFSWHRVEKKEETSRIKETCNQIATACTEAINTAMRKIGASGRIWAENIGYKPSEETHVATLLHVDDKVIFLDLYKDLFRIQNGMKTCYFAPSIERLKKEKAEYPYIGELLKGIECTTIPDEELMKMDKKCGYNKNGIYMDDALAQLKKELQQINDINDVKRFVGDIECEDREVFLLNFKLEFISRYLMNCNEEKKLDISELTKFYMKAYYTLLSDKEIKECKLNRTDIQFKGEPSVLFKITTQKEVIYFIYKGKDEGFKRITEEELNRLKNNKIIIDNSIVMICK